MGHWKTRIVRHGEQTECGATLVEMAIVLPVLLLLIFGLIEMGVAFKSYLTVSSAVRDGARVAAIAGNDPDADCSVLREIGTALAGAGELADLQRIEIFEASQGTGAVIGTPNTYRLQVAGDPNVCGDWTQLSYGYPETTRGTTVGPATDLDIIGVRVIVTKSWITGLQPFNGPYDIDDSNLRRLEPEAYQT
jgi:Flp pilus assembly protein TadG